MVEIITEKSQQDDKEEMFQCNLVNNDQSPIGLSDHSYNSDEATSGTMTISLKEEPKKRRGGWPKGKKRKIPPSIALPKAPVTGYLLYINEKRQLLRKSNPDIPFSEATRILGNEWSTMPVKQKQVYLDKAEVDKKRYVSDLVSYKKKLQKESVKKGANEINTDSVTKDLTQLEMDEKREYKSHDINLETLDGDILFCEICNQYFVNYHNKQEHMYGKQHLMNMTNKVGKRTNESLTDSSILKIHGTSNHNGKSNNKTNFISSSVPKAMEDVISFNMDRESEITHLKSNNQHLKENKKTMLKELKILEQSRNKASLKLEELKAVSVTLTAQLVNLRMVPTLFGVINF